MHYIKFKKLKLIHLLEYIHIKVCLTLKLYASPSPSVTLLYKYSLFWILGNKVKMSKRIH